MPTESILVQTIFRYRKVKFIGLICVFILGLAPFLTNGAKIGPVDLSNQNSPSSNNVSSPAHSINEELSKPTYIVSQPIGVNLRTEPRFDKKSQVNIRFGAEVNPVVHIYKSSQSGETVSLGFPKVAEASHNSCLVDKNSARQCWVPIEWEGSQYWIWGEWLDVRESPKQLVQVDP
jgi:hypothetical protein